MLTVCEGFVLLLTHVLGDLGLDTIEAFLEPFLNDHTVEEPGEKDFVVLRRIGVVGGCSARDQRVELSKHEANCQPTVTTIAGFNLHEHSVFVPSIWQVDEYDFAEQVSSYSCILPVFRYVQDNPEFAS
jgi:hypothetical protein